MVGVPAKAATGAAVVARRADAARPSPPSGAAVAAAT